MTFVRRVEYHERSASARSAYTLADRPKMCAAAATCTRPSCACSGVHLGCLRWGRNPLGLYPFAAALDSCADGGRSRVGIFLQRIHQLCRWILGNGKMNASFSMSKAPNSAGHFSMILRNDMTLSLPTFSFSLVVYSLKVTDECA